MARSRGSTDFTTKEKASRHEALNPLLQAMHQEFQELSKKKSDGVLNKGKVQIVNRLLKDVQAILGTEPSRSYLDLLDEVSLPQNSDVSLILSQYCAAMKSFHEKYFGWDGIEHTWLTK